MDFWMSTGPGITRRLAAAGMIGLIAALPWAYGGVEQRFRSIAATVLAACLLLAAAGILLAPPRSGSWKALLIPVLPFTGLMLLGGLQLLGGVLPLDAAEATGGPQTIYPGATRLALAGLIAAAAATLLGASLFSGDEGLQALLAGCLVSAAAVAVVGIGMRLTGEDRVIRGLAVVGDPFARFVNRNNGAAYLQLGIAAGLTLLRSAWRPQPGREHARFLACGWRGADRPTVLIAVTCLTAVCLAGVVASRSRGGMVAAALTVVIGAGSFLRAGGGAPFLIALSPVAAAGALVAWLGIADPATERFKYLSAEEVLAGGRVPHWKDAARAAADRPVWGAGLGTYGYAYQEFAEYASTAWFEHADGHFVELLVEAGAAGAAAVGLGLALLIYSRLGWGRRPVERTLLLCVVGGQSAHALFDYGIVVPAVGLTAAALWGAGLSRLLRSGEADGSSPRRQWLGSVALALAVAGLLWAGDEHRRAWAVDEFALPAARLLDAEPRLDVTHTERLLWNLLAALRDRPDDAEGLRTAGHLRVHLYRLAASARVRALDTTASEGAAWQVTSLPGLHSAANILARSGSGAGLASLREDPVVEEHLIPARRDYWAAAATCPRLTGIRIPLACLSFANSTLDPSGRAEIVTSIRLFPAESATQRTAGRLAWQAGDADLAGRCWCRAFALNPDGYGAVAAELAVAVGPAEAIRMTCPEDPATILRLFADEKLLSQPDLRRILGERLGQVLEEIPPGPTHDRAIAVAAWMTEKNSVAEGHFRGAIARYPSGASLRTDFARFLWDQGRKAEARDEMRIALALAPSSPELRRIWAAWAGSAVPARGRRSDP